jgi:hypothetical protein
LYESDTYRYAHMKKDVFGEGKRGKVLSFGELLLAAGISGMPAAYMTTPFGKFQRFLGIEMLTGRCREDPIADPSSCW